MRSNTPATAAAQQGAALLAVLLILVVISMLLTHMQQTSRQDLSRIEARALQQQSWAYLLASEALASQGLADQRLRKQPMLWAALRGEPIAYPIDEGALNLQIIDLRTCFNINHLALNSAEASEDLLELLPWQLYLNALASQQQWSLDLDWQDWLDKSRDWLDSDAHALPKGAETGQYLLLNPPSIAANQLITDLSEINWLEPRNRNRFRQLPSSICHIPDQRLQINVNTLPESRLTLLWAILEGQIELSTLEDWWQSRPTIGYSRIEEFWTDLGIDVLNFDPEWKQRVTQRLVLVSDFYQLRLQVQLRGVEHEHDSYLYLEPEGHTQIYTRHRGPVDRAIGTVTHEN